MAYGFGKPPQAIFLFLLVLAHRDALIVHCKFKQPFLRLVEAPAG